MIVTSGGEEKMTIGELRAFIEGMGVQDAPTPDQWERIKSKIEMLQGAPTPSATRFDTKIYGLPERITPDIKMVEQTGGGTGC